MGYLAAFKFVHFRIPKQRKLYGNKKLESSNNKEKVLTKNFTDPVERKPIKTFITKNNNQNMYTTNEQVIPLESRLENYIMALSSKKLKKDIWNYLKKRDPLVTLDRKREKIEKILESNESEEFIEYKVRDLE